MEMLQEASRCTTSSLFIELDEPKRPLVSDPLPSEAEMQEFREYLEGLKDEKYNRHGKILELREEIKQLMDVMEITDLNKYDKQLVNNTEMSPTRLNIQKLVEVHEAFVSQYDKMKFQIEDMHKRLAKLWRYLDIPESHHRQFSKYTDITQTSYNKLLQEVQRCEQIKRENIRNFIEKVRLEIEEYWEKCLKSEAERLRFPSYTENVFNEDVLELHEDELRELKMFYENNEAIFNIIQERQELWSQMELMQNKESDPKRYNNRGGQLLKEERERKMITMKLPKIEARLLELVEKFENENNRPFTMYGAKIEDVIEREYEVKRQEKLTKSGKKILDTPARTPCRVNMTGLRTPLTIEQTIINHTTAMKSTGARLRIATQPRTQSKRAINDTASSTASSVRSVKTNTGKRRLPQQKAPEQNAKRQLLGAFASPSNGNVLRPRNENIVGVKKPASSKNTSMKVYNVGSVIKRRSRKSNGKKPRTSLHKSQRSIRPVPDIVLDQAESTITERDTTSYEGFEVSKESFVRYDISLTLSFLSELRATEQKRCPIIGNCASTVSRRQSLRVCIASGKEALDSRT